VKKARRKEGRKEGKKDESEGNDGEGVGGERGERERNMLAITERGILEGQRNGGREVRGELN
jgi:hypothetical protein